MWASAGGADESFWSESSLIFCECERGGAMLQFFSRGGFISFIQEREVSAHAAFVDGVEVNASSAAVQKWSDICSASVKVLLTLCRPS